MSLENKFRIWVSQRKIEAQVAAVGPHVFKEVDQVVGILWL